MPISRSMCPVLNVSTSFSRTPSYQYLCSILLQANDFESLRNMRYPILYILLVSQITGKIQSRASGRTSNNENPKILILGAGMAGISAAKTLNDLGYHDFLIIEGSDRIGGRTKEAKIGNTSVEMGAFWIQSLGSNPIYKMAQDWNLSVISPDYDDITVFDENGNDITTTADPIWDIYDKMEIRLDNTRFEMQRKEKPDASVRAGMIQTGWFPKQPVQDVVEWYIHDFEQGIPPEETSMKYGFDYTYLIHGNEDDLVVVDPDKGFSYLTRKLKSEFLPKNDKRLILNEIVTDISYNDTHVEVKTKSNSTYTADYAIVTFSIGVLQNRLVDFHPELPLWKKEVIDQFRMAYYLHPYLQFDETFWHKSEHLLYASNRRGFYPFWHNINKYIPGSNILSFTVTDDEASRINRLTDEEIKNEAMQVLRQMYPNITVPEPINFLMPRWLSDPLTMGSYSAWPTGYTNKTHQGMYSPVGRVYFAGEHCVFHHFGYVQGAYYSGIHAGNSLAACIANSSNCEHYKPLYDLHGCT
ncbi:hypothetical protein KUTeg_013732 [Tegillarca granosa]|uniref:Amine oxidase n=1 Tax=Tegillarca granosa TaxID=220873 RepID=A0ABQ9EUJ5_TEGGR|nr:hypothetical protein KUTeg_013732 [Tegillarca granosa]